MVAGQAIEDRTTVETTYDRLKVCSQFKHNSPEAVRPAKNTTIPLQDAKKDNDQRRPKMESLRNLFPAVALRVAKRTFNLWVQSMVTGLLGKASCKPYILSRSYSCFSKFSFEVREGVPETNHGFFYFNPLLPPPPH